MAIYFQSKADNREHRFLSNFHLCNFVYENKTWKSVEHAFQAMKTLDSIERNFIASAETPALAKKHGKEKLTLRPDWNLVKDQIMYEIVKAKFEQNIDLKLKLLDTADEELIEYAPWGDTYWGVDFNFAGQNNLGKILMRIRDENKRIN